MDQEERRLFIGIPVPEWISRSLYGSDPEEEGLRWLSPSVHHVTLCFIGETRMDPETDLLPTLRDEAAKTPPFELPFQGLRIAPPKHPYMVWARFKNVPEFQDLHERLFRTFLPEKGKAREAAPHITLGRMKRGKELKKEMLPPDPGIGSMKVEKLVLWQSVLHREGAVHHPLGDAGLKAG